MKVLLTVITSILITSASSADPVLKDTSHKSIELVSYRFYFANSSGPLQGERIQGTRFPCGSTEETAKQALCPNATFASATYSGLSAPGGGCGYTYYTLACATVSDAKSPR